MSRKRIYFITRSYTPGNEGGILIRASYVKLLKENGFDVVVITPNYNSDELVIENETIKVPFVYNYKIGLALEYSGLTEDYMDFWVKKAYDIIKEKICSDDIIFSTSGGELGCIKLGALLKSFSGAKLVVNFHDPLDYSLVFNKKIRKLPHMSREKTEKKYLDCADFIITSSEKYKKALLEKHPDYRNKIMSNYFGFIDDIRELPVVAKDGYDKYNLVVGYGGAMSKAQSPEILMKAINQVSDIHLCLIGNVRSAQLALKNEKMITLEPMRHEEFVNYEINNFDIGLVSLADDYFGACVPSKLYEYISLGIPVLGVLPEGDALDIINSNGYGIGVLYNDTAGMINALNKFKDSAFRDNCRAKIAADREKWAMQHLIRDVITLLNSL